MITLKVVLIDTPGRATTEVRVQLGCEASGFLQLGVEFSVLGLSSYPFIHRHSTADLQNKNFELRDTPRSRSECAMLGSSCVWRCCIEKEDRTQSDTFAATCYYGDFRCRCHNCHYDDGGARH